MPTILVTDLTVTQDSAFFPSGGRSQSVLTSTHPRRDGSGGVDLGAWFCAKVVYPSIEALTGLGVE